MSKQRLMLGTLAWLACGLPVAIAQAQTPPLAAQASADDARRQLAGASGEQPSTAWRYRKFKGQWWYFLPNQQWARWDGRQWSVPSAKAGDYHEWRQQQLAGRYTDSAALDAEMRRREVDRWREQAAKKHSNGLAQSDADYRAQVDRFHDYLMITPYDYRIGTQGHGLFEANPDRTIANTGRFNYATSLGGYMGGALRTPYGY
ncbi:MAG TPA: hypothetical protein VG826_36005 [Pirellulales bacterium]|nr:hypothetical protein [Pirellulales bacterium]